MQKTFFIICIPIHICMNPNYWKSKISSTYAYLIEKIGKILKKLWDIGRC